MGQRTEGLCPGKDDRRVSREACMFIPAQGGQGSCGWQSGTSGLAALTSCWLQRKHMG